MRDGGCRRQAADMSTYIRAVVAAKAIKAMKEEYITKGEAIEAACNAVELFPSEYQEIENAINGISADVVPIVRCKDCRLRGREECAMFYRCECGEQHTWETDNDFCSYGERL